jgi:phosphorylcholine metabolism protein LicD
MDEMNDINDDIIHPGLHHSLLYGMLNLIQNALEHQNVKVFLEGGSLLGCIRDKGIIPHDDDIDIGYFDRDRTKIVNILKSMIDSGSFLKVEDQTGKVTEYKLHFVELPSMLKIYIPDLWAKDKDTNEIIGTPTIDFFSYTKSGDKIKLTSLAQRREFKNCYFLKSEFPLVKRKFGNLEFKIV